MVNSRCYVKNIYIYHRVLSLNFTLIQRKIWKIMSKCFFDKWSRVLNLVFLKNSIFHENHQSCFNLFCFQEGSMERSCLICGLNDHICSWIVQPCPIANKQQNQAMTKNQPSSIKFGLWVLEKLAKEHAIRKHQPEVDFCIVIRFSCQNG